jgi:vitamin B12 transporter
MDSTTYTDRDMYDMIYNGFGIEQYNDTQFYMDVYKDPVRIRQWNSYKNDDALIKWQNDNLFVKFAWQNIDRHIPNSLLDEGYFPVSVADTVFMTELNFPRKQKVDNRDFTVGWRDRWSNFEYGVTVNYFDQNKRYISLIPDSLKSKPRFAVALTQWSRYESDKLSIQGDAEYKLGNRQIIELMANYSNEHLSVYGFCIRDGDCSTIYYTVAYRTEYEQRLINVQLQDTITLDNSNSFWLTLSAKYNYSRIFSPRPSVFDPNHVSTFVDINQTNSKYSWQAALKKTFGDIFTLRATYGTYYRLLNLYEIAGDGAGIIPFPDDSKRPTFPEPEEGTQFDISAILDTRLLGSDSRFQVTYFRRDSKKMLQLYQMAYDYMSYTNSVEGKVHGVELEINMAWEKFDIFISATKLGSSLQRRDDTWTLRPQYRNQKIRLAHVPKEEVHVRINIRPFEFISLFSELQYTGEMYTDSWYHKGNSYEAMTVVGFGAKVQLPYGLQVVVGVNDFFNKGPEQRIIIRDELFVVPDRNVRYPSQGRTIYATATYNY